MINNISAWCNQIQTINSWIGNPKFEKVLNGSNGIHPELQRSLSHVQQLLETLSENPKTPQLPVIFSYQFYELADHIFRTKAEMHYDRLKKTMESLYEELTKMPLEEFRARFTEHFSELRSWDNVKHNSQLFSNSNNFLYRNCLPNTKRRYGPWTKKETEQLIMVLYDGVKDGSDYITPNRRVLWGLLSLRIEGRVGYQCQQKYKQLLESGQIQDIKSIENSPWSSFEKFCQPALLHDQEELLAQTVDQMLSEKQYVTSLKIASMALELFHEPSHLARKAAIAYSIDEKIPYTNPDGTYVELIETLKDQYLEQAENVPSVLLNDINIRLFSASRTWVFSFMNKYHYSYKKVHYSRRGAVVPEAVGKYLNHLSDAILRYGRAKVLNMDETHFLINNYSTSAIQFRNKGTMELNY